MAATMTSLFHQKLLNFGVVLCILSAVHFLKRIPGPDPNYNDICFTGAGRDVSQLPKIFPQVEMVFNNGKKLLLSPENYLFRHSKASGAYCLGIFPNSEPTTLLGGMLCNCNIAGIVVQNTLVTYDRGNDRIGFLKTNCSELWRRVNFSGAPAPTPLVSPSKDTKMEIPSVLSPSGSPSNVLPGAWPITRFLTMFSTCSLVYELMYHDCNLSKHTFLYIGSFHVGFITFDMSISTTDSNLKSILKELTELISEELEVDNSQVRLLSVTSQEKDYLVRWGIFPAEPANYISNTIARSIILRLRDHRIQLPERFGNYKLMEWNAEPQRKLYALFSHY
ncbi:protein ASPARTIC PROTEASE IN GUARD CELL 1 isoform X2 [Gossypium australe]|uniref:Protein ASPARTIC PROTEASE IN GUARD CELL 1 isoform X2 n=1 Tax=Gossypium australe TaxID=47621 RepID=A0A5B6X573_9ROSI|nr:protein ASPARTIC PROTEASE IN GUARD CELL 1 isoform X2 [Gossypium australe]